MAVINYTPAGGGGSFVGVGDLSDSNALSDSANGGTYTLSLLGWSDISSGGFQESIPGDTNTVVPEPNSVSTFLVGLFILILWRSVGSGRRNPLS